MKKWVKPTIIALMIAAVIIPLVVWMIIQNASVELNTVTVKEENLPKSFDGFRIAHVSDLHSAEFGEENGKLLSVVRAADPDLIVITGDFMDCRDRDTKIALAFAARAMEIAPCCYITGNHEARLPKTIYRELIDGLEHLDVWVLNDEEKLLTRDGETISVVGHFWGDTDQIGDLSDFDGYRILLSHHPEDMANYTAGGYDLVMSGHAHGGQFRLPLVGGLFAPGQGFFPKYTSGLYSLGKTDMIVSRGIGDSAFLPRFNNPPEVILVVLKCG